MKDSLKSICVAFERGGEYLVEAKESTYSIKRILYVKVGEHVGKYKATQGFFQSYDSGINRQIIIYG